MKHKFNVGDKVKFKTDQSDVECCEVIKWKREKLKEEDYMVITSEGLVVGAKENIENETAKIATERMII